MLKIERWWRRQWQQKHNTKTYRGKQYLYFTRQCSSIYAVPLNESHWIRNKHALRSIHTINHCIDLNVDVLCCWLPSRSMRADVWMCVVVLLGEPSLYTQFTHTIPLNSWLRSSYTCVDRVCVCVDVPVYTVVMRLCEPYFSLFLSSRRKWDE